MNYKQNRFQESFQLNLIIIIITDRAIVQLIDENQLLDLNKYWRTKNMGTKAYTHVAFGITVFISRLL